MTEQVGVILYGPPASGKDSVTAALSLLDSRFQLFRRLKVGAGRTTGYRMGTASELSQLDAAGQIIYSNSRYGARYVIDRPEITRMVDSGTTPVVHVGQPEAIRALVESMPKVRWLTVELWCPREIAAARIRARNTGDDNDRLRVYDETVHLTDVALQIDTSKAGPDEAARAIREQAGMDWTVVVPVLHMTDSAGQIDVVSTREYAERASRTWVDKFLVNGSTTRGDALSDLARRSVLDIWAESVGPDRLLACCWDSGDLAAARERCITPMAVMQGLATPNEALAYFRQLPSDATVYSHPIFGITLTPDLALQAAAENSLPAGGKLAKVSLPDIEQMKTLVPGFTLWDGSSRRIRQSLVAGASGIVATPLAAHLDETLSSKSITAVQTIVNQVQAELDLLPDRAGRGEYLRRLAKERSKHTF